MKDGKYARHKLMPTPRHDRPQVCEKFFENKFKNVLDPL